MIMVGCKQSEKSSAQGSKKLSVVCTVFPQYDWVKQILGNRADDAEVTLLINNRIDLHSYQPSVSDIAKIKNCDVFIYVGGESDEWVADVLKDGTNPNMKVINLLEALGDAAKVEETVEGMQDAHDDDHDHGDKHHDKHKHDHKKDHAAKDDHHNDDNDDDDDKELDEHIWLSLKNAQSLAAVIAETLSSIDSANAAEYQANLAAYVEKLTALDAEYQAAVSASSVKTLLFADRFPFRYLMDDYGLKYFAAFSGCSAETEASFETIVFLAKKIDALELKSVMVTESADQSIAKTVISNTRGKDQQILVLNAMQSVTSADARGGTTYLSIMESNLNVLKEALK